MPSNDATAGAASARPAGSAASSNGANNRLYYPTGERDTSMLLLERTGPAQVRVGKPYDYQITVTNLTNTPLRGVTVQEMLPGFFAVSGDSAGSAKTDAARTDAAKADADAAARDMAAHKEGGGAAMVQHTYVIGELGPRESRTINLRGTPSQAGQLNACTSVTCNPTLCTAALITNPQMRLTKESIGSGDLCEVQTIRYTVTNAGTGDLTNVRIEDQLPQGLVTESGSYGSVALKIGTIPQGQSKTADVKVKAGAAGEFASAATAIADDDVTAKSKPLAMNIKAPQFEVALKAPEKEYLGQQLKYEVTVKNVGNATARSPKVRIDAGGEDVAAAGAAAGANGRDAQLAAARGDTAQQVGELAPGASKTITIPYSPKAEGDLRVNAVVIDPCAKPASAAGLTHIAGLPALLLSAVDDHDPIRIGENVTYTITVLNQGFGADKNIKVVATIPEGEQYVSSAGASEGNLDGNKLTFAPVKNLAPKQTVTWTVIVKAAKAADVRFRVDMTSDYLTEPAIKMEPTRLY